jgi:hypothetical protein
VLGSGTIGDTQMPALTYDAAASTLWLAQTGPGNVGGKGTIQLYQVTGAVGQELLSTGPSFQADVPWNTDPLQSPNLGPQLGSATTIQVNDTRMQAVVYRNGHVYCAHTVLLPAVNPTRSAVQWWEVNPATTTGTPVQQARIDGGSSAVMMAHPSLAVSASGAITVGYSRFRSDAYASAAYRYRAAGDALGTLQGEVVLKAGEAPYVKTLGGTVNWWGDYSAATVDPSQPERFWLLGEYAKAPQNVWGTWCGSFMTGACAQTGSLRTARYAHTATLLTTGKVLVVGGYDGSAYLSSVELYDPATGTWTTKKPLNTARGYHTATLLSDGRVLVVGGYNGSASLGSAELYDPLGDTWTTITHPLNTARYSHSATLLSDGRILVVGGLNASVTLRSAEIFTPGTDPTTGTWTTTPPPNTARSNHSATLLSTGKVLISGGKAGSTTLMTAELYDPTMGTTGSWAQTGSLKAARYGHRATLLTQLANGKVLVSGGFNGSASLSSAELYNPGTSPTTGTWTLTTHSLNTARYFHTATLLQNGKVLVVGGLNGTTALLSAELYDPATAAPSKRNANESEPADAASTFGAGNAGTMPMSGDVDGSGMDTLGLYNPASGAFFLRNETASRAANLMFGYGPVAATPLIGNWGGQ